MLKHHNLSSRFEPDHAPHHSSNQISVAQPPTSNLPENPTRPTTMLHHSARRSPNRLPGSYNCPRCRNNTVSHRVEQRLLTILTILTRLLQMKTQTVGTLEAKTRFSELLKKVEQGWKFRITRHGRPVAELTPLQSKVKRPRPGFAKGCFVFVADDFDAPLHDFQDYMS